jgi:hypothetical protein
MRDRDRIQIDWYTHTMANTANDLLALSWGTPANPYPLRPAAAPMNGLVAEHIKTQLTSSSNLLDVDNVQGLADAITVETVMSFLEYLCSDESGVNIGLPLAQPRVT